MNNPTPEFGAHKDTRFLVLDFETLTPRGRPPEPIEVAAILCTPETAASGARFSRLIRPPDDVDFTSFDVGQTGIQPEDVENASLAKQVLAELDRSLHGVPVVVVAHNANYEAGVVRRYSTHCPTLSGSPYIDTVTLARFLLPKLPNHKLDTLLTHFGLRFSGRRHRALPDTEATLVVFTRLLALGVSTRQLSTELALMRAAGIRSNAPPPEPQLSLFGPAPKSK